LIFYHAIHLKKEWMSCGETWSWPPVILVINKVILNGGLLHRSSWKGSQNRNRKLILKFKAKVENFSEGSPFLSTTNCSLPIKGNSFFSICSQPFRRQKSSSSCNGQTIDQSTKIINMATKGRGVWNGQTFLCNFRQNISTLPTKVEMYESISSPTHSIWFAYRK